MLELVIVSMAGCTMVLLAAGMSSILGWANRAFYVYVDPKVEKLNDALPGANCGGCEYVGCNEYAEALAAGDAPVSLCTVGGQSCAEDLADVMGVEVEESWPLRAVVHCGADFDVRKGRNLYLGEATCAAANVISGVQGCFYGCLGLGDCVEACDYDALHMKNGLAIVDYDACIGCSLCARVCPRNIISMIPFKTKEMLVVACSNKDMGNEVRAVCGIGCIGCKACSKVSDLFTMSDNRAVIDYDNYDPEVVDFAPVLKKCPMESLMFAGRPSAAKPTGDEERVEADFKTTVDKTEWRT